MPRTILLVDDETLVLDIACKKLQNNGYTVLTATNGVEALKVLEKHKPELIVLDIQMPIMNGYSFLMEIEKRGLMDIPLIILTAFDAMEPIFKRHGIKAYLMKPLKLDELAKKVDEALNFPPEKLPPTIHQ